MPITSTCKSLNMNEKKIEKFYSYYEDCVLTKDTVIFIKTQLENNPKEQRSKYRQKQSICHGGCGYRKCSD